MSTTNPNEPTGSNIFNFLPGTVSAPGVGFMNIGGISGGFDEYITGSFGLKSFTAHVLKEGYKMMTDAKYEPKKYQGEK